MQLHLDLLTSIWHSIFLIIIVNRRIPYNIHPHLDPLQESKDIRAALCCDAFTARQARQHNDANVLCLRGEDIDTDSALEIVATFLAADFEGGRHVQKVNKVKALERD